MRRHAWSILLSIAMVLGLGLRSINVTQPQLVDFHAWRQADTAAFTNGYLTETLNPFDPRLDRFPCEYRNEPFGRVEAELPVASWMAALPLAALGKTTAPAPYLRVVSVLFFLGTCAYLFHLTVRLGESKVIASIAVLVFSILPVSAFFTRTVQPDGPALFFSCAFLYHLERWQVGAGKLHPFASAAFASLALLQKISGALLFFPAVYLIVSQRGLFKSLSSWRLWVWGMAILAPVGAWYAYASRNSWSFGIWQDKYSELWHLTDSYYWKVFSERFAFDLLTWAGIILLVLGLQHVGRSRAVRFAAVWIASVLVFIALTLPGNDAHAYYQLPIAPPASIVIAMAIVELARRGWPGRVVLAGLAIVHAMITREILTSYHQPTVDIADGSALLIRHVPRGARIVSTDRNPALFYNAGVEAWFPGSADLGVAEQCMGSDVDYLLVDVETQDHLDRFESVTQRFETAFEKVESVPLFTLWRKKRP